MSATLAYVAPESPDELLAINEAAHQAELAAERDRQEAEEAGRIAEQIIRAKIEADQTKKARAYARAYAVVADALLEGGCHPRNIPDAAALYQRAIGDMLLEISTMPVTNPRQYGADSSPADIAKGAAVGALLSGSAP